MKDRSQLVRGGTRALTGLVITGIAAAGAVTLSMLEIPNFSRAPHAISVDTTLSGSHSVVCSGPFAELGADPSRPDVATPVGRVNVVATTGTSGVLAALGEGGGEIFSAPIGEPLAATQSQQLQSSTLWGAVASSCTEPVNDQWLLGGASTLGQTSTLTIGNASDVPATVGITVFDENGEVAGFQTAGVIVAPKSQQTVSLNGYAPDRERLAVRVTSTGAPVTAVLSVAAVDGLKPVGVATVTHQLRPETRVVIPGITNADDHDPKEVPGDAGDNDRFPLLVQALSLGEHDARARVSAIDGKGNLTELGTIDLAPNAIGNLQVATWPRGATAIVIDSEVPIYAGAFGTSNEGDRRDFDWFAPAPLLPSSTMIAAPVAAGGKLIIANPGGLAADVTIGGSEPTEVTVPAGAAVSVSAAGDATITSTEPVHASVRMLAPGLLAGYPIMPPAEQSRELTVYTR